MFSKICDAAVAANLSRLIRARRNIQLKHTKVAAAPINAISTTQKNDKPNAAPTLPKSTAFTAAVNKITWTAGAVK